MSESFDDLIWEVIENDMEYPGLMDREAAVNFVKKIMVANIMATPLLTEALKKFERFEETE